MDPFDSSGGVAFSAGEWKNRQTGKQPAVRFRIRRYMRVVGHFRRVHVKHFSGCIRVLAIFALFVSTVIVARAQTVTGSIRGTVTDQTGAVIAGTDV